MRRTPGPCWKCSSPQGTPSSSASPCSASANDKRTPSGTPAPHSPNQGFPRCVAPYLAPSLGQPRQRCSRLSDPPGAGGGRQPGSTKAPGMRLTLTKQAEYALRAVVWLAQAGATAGEEGGLPVHREKAAAIAHAAGIPPVFAARVLAHLQ